MVDLCVKSRNEQVSEGELQQTKGMQCRCSHGRRYQWVTQYLKIMATVMGKVVDVGCAQVGICRIGASKANQVIVVLTHPGTSSHDELNVVPMDRKWCSQWVDLLVKVGEDGRRSCQKLPPSVGTPDTSIISLRGSPWEDSSRLWVHPGKLIVLLLVQ